MAFCTLSTEQDKLRALASLATSVSNAVKSDSPQSQYTVMKMQHILVEAQHLKGIVSEERLAASAEKVRILAVSLKVSSENIVGMYDDNANTQLFNIVVQMLLD